jgi:hypothetical protein
MTIKIPSSFRKAERRGNPGIISRALFLIALLEFTAADAGHGMLNAFAGIEWLPQPGITPDAPYYVLDTWNESLQLMFARTPEKALGISLAKQRKKLAELEAMIRANNKPAALIAIARYRDLLHTMREQLSLLKNPTKLTETITCANALLEQQYILSTDYLDLPRDSRIVASEFMAQASQHYQALTRELTGRTKDSLLFKEDEVRWSWEVALAADKQGM